MFCWILMCTFYTQFINWILFVSLIRRLQIVCIFKNYVVKLTFKLNIGMSFLELLLSDSITFDVSISLAFRVLCFTHRFLCETKIIPIFHLLLHLTWRPHTTTTELMKKKKVWNIKSKWKLIMKLIKVRKSKYFDHLFFQKQC